MNNGSVLNNLLAISGAGVTNAKNASAQSAKSDNDNFQTTFDRVRPDVAARKPDARRDTPPKPANKAPLDNQRAAEKASARRDLPNNTAGAGNHQVRHKSHQVERSPAPESRASSQKPDSGNPPLDKEASAITEASASIDAQVETALEQEEVVSAVDDPAVSMIDSSTLALTIAAEVNPEEAASGVAFVSDLATLPMQLTEDQLASSDAVLNPEAAMVALSISALVKESDLSGTIGDGVEAAQVLAGLVDSTQVTSNSLTDDMTSAGKGLLAGLNASMVGATADPVIVDGALQASVQGLAQSAGQLGADNMTQAAAQSAVQNMPQNSVLKELPQSTPVSVLASSTAVSDTFSLEELGVDLKSHTEPQSTEQAGSESADVELGGDNPDFLLLNSKAALNKLSEANFTSLDKGSPLADAAKPAAANSPALEALTRLTESQSPAARAFVVQTGVPVTVGQPQWTQAVGEKVLWLAAQNVSAAEIRLDPPELGPMQVRVSVNQDQASVTFTSPHPMVRDVLDQQLNRLREMFAEQGLNLVNVDVSDKSFAQQEREKNESGKSHVASEEEELVPLATSTLMSTRLVDHYA